MRSRRLNPILLILPDFYGFMEIGSNSGCCLSFQRKMKVSLALSSCGAPFNDPNDLENLMNFSPLVVGTAGLVLPDVSNG